MPGVTRLGLTGGIGSGKSTVGAMLAGHGAALIDADAISRQTTATGGTAITPIRESFGPDFITPEGSLDRHRMRTLAFQDPSARGRLEQIIHPLVGREIRRQAQAAIASVHRCVVFDIPLLVESVHWRPQLDQILVLDCRIETQIERVMQRSTMSRPEVQSILDNQASRNQRLRAADLVICNDGLSLADLAHLVRQVATRFGL